MDDSHDLTDFEDIDVDVGRKDGAEENADTDDDAEFIKNFKDHDGFRELMRTLHGGELSVDDYIFRPSAVAELVKLNECEQFFQYEILKEWDRDEADSNAPETAGSREWTEAKRDLNVVLSYDGGEFEKSVEDRLRNYVGTMHEFDDNVNAGESLRVFTQQIEAAVDDEPWHEDGEIRALTQMKVNGRIGDNWFFNGDADLILIWPEEDGKARVRVIDMKASFDEKTHHRFQVGIYTTILRDELGDSAGDVELEGGIWERSSDAEEDTWKPEPDTPPDADEFPQFRLAPVENDIQRLMGEDGEWTETRERVYNNPETIRYQLDGKCYGCQYAEACYADSIERAGLELLGITEAEQKALESYGFETLYDLAQIGWTEHHVDGEYTDPGVFDQIRYQDPKYRELVRDSRISDLSRLVQQADMYVKRFGEHATDQYTDPEWLLSSGDGSFPLVRSEYDPRDEPGYDPDSVIRVSLHLQEDHRRDRLKSISAHIISTAALKNGADPVRISAFEPGVPDSIEAADVLERNILESFVPDLFDACRSIADAGENGRNVPVHFQIFDGNDYEFLTDATYRQRAENRDVVTDEAHEIGAFHDLLTWEENLTGDGSRHHMVSLVKPELEQRMSLPVPNDGMLPLLAECGFPMQLCDRMMPGTDDFKYTDPGTGEEIDLQKVFRTGLFDYADPAVKDGDKQALTLYFDNKKVPDDADSDFYSGRPRKGSRIPLKYLWGVGNDEEHLADEWLQYADEDEDDEPVKEYIQPFIYHDPDAPEPKRITERDVEELGKRLANVVAHFAGIITERDWSIEKRDVDLDNPSEQFYGADTLASACREFLELEHKQTRDEARKTYEMPVRERVLSGDSIYLRVLGVNEDEGTVVGCLGFDYDSVLTDSPDGHEKDSSLDGIASKVNVSGAPHVYKQTFREAQETVDGGSAEQEVYRWKGSGEYMVATEVGDITQLGNANPIKYVDEEDVRPQYLRHHPQMEVFYIDPLGENDSDVDDNGYRTVRMQLKSGYGTNDFTFYHNEAEVCSPDEAAEVRANGNMPIYKGQFLVLDPAADDVNGGQHYRMFDSPEAVRQHPVAQELDGMRKGHMAVPRISGADDSHVQQFLENYGTWAEDNDTFTPNKEQTDFIEKTTYRYNLLQGPPGTGKTKGALGPMLLSRVFAAEADGESLQGLIGAPSNTALDELIEDVADLYETLSGYMDGNLDSLELVRLVRGDFEPDEEEIDSPIEYVHIKSPEARDVMSRLRNEGGSQLVFATSYRAINLLDEWGRLQYPDAKDTDGEDPARKIVEHQDGPFDVLALDEASMLRLPQLLVYGSGVKPDGEIAVVGDHRQMPPVLKRDWDSERRFTLTQTVPYVSTLDYFRMLEGGDVVPSEHQPPLANEVDFEMTQLAKTYRCNPAVASFLREHYYKPLDGINYRYAGGDRDPIPVSAGVQSDAVRAAASPDAPITVIVHDEEESQKMNTVEQHIALSVIESLETGAKDDPDSEEVGVVSPHRAQAATLDNNLRSLPVDSESETVERFQGGEKDVIAVSVTASDMSFLRGEDEFILSPNRLNVAISRMKKKLVIIVSENVFGLMPNDAEVYDNSLLWKVLYDVADVLHADADVSATADEFYHRLGEGSPDDLNETNIDVYGVTENDL